MEVNEKKELKTATELMDDFLTRTGIQGSGGDPGRRYLWTDAFAVQACFALYHLLDRREYFEYALKLIDQVHGVLGRHRKDDPRTGWISGLSGEEGKAHPTAGGLRIGKELPERPSEEPFNQQLEWERDGRYFHYLTRWFNALLQASEETNDKKYALWAAELIKAGEKFIRKHGQALHMVCKMNIDLSQPVVESMGAHDPLEGLVCAISAINAVPREKSSLKPVKQDLKTICKGMSWITSDALGIGGLLINTARTAELKLNGASLPENIHPESLFTDGMTGLKLFADETFRAEQPARFRLAFRECGLTLGFNALYEMKNRYNSLNMDLGKMDDFVSMADGIENFWINPSNRQSSSWRSHLDINTVTLASSLLAKDYPESFV